jgi:hypothetical protein
MLSPHTRTLAVIVSLYLVSPVGYVQAQTADTVLFNGKILTVDKEFSVQQALAIGHGQVLASGTSAAMKKLAGDKARLIDLGGRTRPRWQQLRRTIRFTSNICMTGCC